MVKFVHVFKKKFRSFIMKSITRTLKAVLLTGLLIPAFMSSCGKKRSACGPAT